MRDEKIDYGTMVLGLPWEKSWDDYDEDDDGIYIDMMMMYKSYYVLFH